MVRYMREHGVIIEMKQMFIPMSGYPFTNLVCTRKSTIFCLISAMHVHCVHFKKNSILSFVNSVDPDKLASELIRIHTVFIHIMKLY